MHRFIVSIFALFGVFATAAAQPKIVVNIVVGGMKASDLERYESNFSDKVLTCSKVAVLYLQSVTPTLCPVRQRWRSPQ